MKAISVTALHLAASFVSLQKASCFTSTSKVTVLVSPSLTVTRPTRKTALQLYQSNNNNRYDKELEQKATQSALQKQPTSNPGSTAAGVILGGLVGGPFGALFGASIGSRLGSQTAFDKARKAEMEKMGVTEEMLQTAQDMGTALERGVEGLQATQDALRTQQGFAKRLEGDAERVYEDAKQALGDGNEERAKDLLFQKSEIEDKMKKALMNCVEEKGRLNKMEENVRALEEKAIEFESLLKRNVGAKAFMDSSSSANVDDDIDFGFSLKKEDPLLQKFRDAGID